MHDRLMVNTDGHINGVRSIILQNDNVRATILPEIGGKIYELTWKPDDWQILWHNPRVAPQPFPIEAFMTDYWCGGWDDIFPTCSACEFGGLRYPALGELHQARFSVDDATIQNGAAVARLSAFTTISPMRAHKTIIVDESGLRICYKIANLASVPVDFIWGTHPAFRPGNGMVLHIPAKTGIVAQSSGAQFGTLGERYNWPKLNQDGYLTDMSQVCGVDAKGFCGHCVSDLDEGWYALEEPESGRFVIVSFPLDVCPFLWIWLSYGGWRGHWVMIVEPYTSYPINLAESVRARSHRRLGPNQTFSVEIRVTFGRKPETLEEALIRAK